MMTAPPCVLTIAGSDPSGGAGVQADLKTLAVVGVYGAAVLTALTAQNTRTVAGAMPVPADFVRRQLDAVLSDIPIDILKLGMMPNREICEVVAPFLEGRVTVCDPVMISTSGCDLIDDPAIAALVDHVLPCVSYLTPNLDELTILHRGPLATLDDIREAGLGLMARFPRLVGVVLKGGHFNLQGRDVIDMLLLREENRILEYMEANPRIVTQNLHGTGCTFASAFAAFLAKKQSPPHAFSKAVTFTHRLIALSQNLTVGQGHGPLMHHLGR